MKYFSKKNRGIHSNSNIFSKTKKEHVESVLCCALCVLVLNGGGAVNHP